MIQILWLAPNFNHYKARFLSHFAKEAEIALELLSGTGRTGFGDRDLDQTWNYKIQQLPISKKKFGFSAIVRKALRINFKSFDWILIPAEKKNLPLFLYAIWLRNAAIKKGVKVRLFSYNHPVLQSGNGRITKLDIYLTKFFYKHLDRTIFYTEDSCKWAITNNFINPERAYWANNTVDTIEINKFYNFVPPPDDAIRILFIGRLIPSKNIKRAIAYFEMLQKKFQTKPTFLEIIGDGPDRVHVKAAMAKNNQINWYGALVDEAEISPIMKTCSCIFIPGESGLSINHAFAYGRPYITFESLNHGPEISYLTHFKNGMILKNGDDNENLELIYSLLIDKTRLLEYCDSANRAGEELSVLNWVKKVKDALLDD